MFACSVCGREVRTERGLSIHYTRCHPSIPDSHRTPTHITPVTSHQCGLCLFQCPTHRGLATHVTRMHPSIHRPSISSNVPASSSVRIVDDQQPSTSSGQRGNGPPPAFNHQIPYMWSDSDDDDTPVQPSTLHVPSVDSSDERCRYLGDEEGDHLEPTTEAPEEEMDVDYEEIEGEPERMDVDDEERLDIPAPSETLTMPSIAILNTPAVSQAATVQPHCVGSMVTGTKCFYCGAWMFPSEAVGGTVATREQGKRFSMCCMQGKLRLPPDRRPCHIPPLLLRLMTEDSEESRNYRQNIRKYNSGLAMACLKIQEEPVPGRGPRIVRIHGQAYHLVSRYLPDSNQQTTPQYSQLYFIEPELAKTIRSQHPANADCLPFLFEELDLMLRNLPNPFVTRFMTMAERMRADRESGNLPSTLSLLFTRDDTRDQRRYNAPTSDQIAVIFTGEQGQLNNEVDFSITLRPAGTTPMPETQCISHLSPRIDPLCYPLLLPGGQFGWQPNLPFGGPTHNSSQGVRTSMTIKDHYMLQLAYKPILLPSGTHLSLLHHSHLLTQQYICDGYIKKETNDLQFQRRNQDKLRADLYGGLVDHVVVGHGQGSDHVGRNIILAPSFEGGPRNMHKRYQDAMAIVREFGKPDYFVTFTCNPNWPEIREAVGGVHVRSSDRPDLIARVFNLKIKALMKDLVQKRILGRVKAWVYTIEFQKRGLPHAHILLIMDDEFKPSSGDRVDHLISAEIPDPTEDPVLHELVCAHMIHGPCGSFDPSQPCMKNGTCSKDFPKQFRATTSYGEARGYPEYRRRDTGRTAEVRGKTVDNRFVVPHNAYLLKKYTAHINVEVCSSVKSVKYLYKYIYKGHDCTTVEVSNDEIQRFVDARYVSASEASWRLFGFRTHGRSHQVVQLPVHLPNMHTVYFQAGSNLETVLQQQEANSLLLAFFKLSDTNPSARQYLYSEIPLHFVANKKKWEPKRRNSKTVVRMSAVDPRDEERYYLRLLLLRVRGPRSFEDLRTVDGVICPTFKEAARQLGLLESDEVWFECMTDAASFQMPKQLRELFAVVCIYSTPSDALALYHQFADAMSEDFVVQRNASGQVVQQTREFAINRSLVELDSLFRQNFSTLQNFGLPLPQEIPPNTEQEYDVVNEQARAEEMRQSLNEDQRQVFEEISNAINNHEDKCNIFFLDAPGGTGKTFLISTLLHAVRGVGKIAVPVASTGIAAILLEGGRTAHSRFKIPLQVNEGTTSSITLQSQAGSFLLSADLIVWDEAPVCTWRQFKVVDDLFRFLCSSQPNQDRLADIPFGGKVVLLSGDFRQVLPVIPRGNRAQIVSHSLKRSPIWDQIARRPLTVNMRAAHGDPEFPPYLLQLGSGCPPLTNNNQIIIEDRFICQGPLEEFVFGQAVDARDPTSYSQSAVLCPTNDACHVMNDIVLRKYFASQETRTYLSNDDVLDDNLQPNNVFEYPLEFANSLTPQGLPPHKLQLCVGAIVMLLRNLSPDGGLCNGTRIVVSTLRPHMFEGIILTGPKAGGRCLIPRIKLITSENLPFTLRRCQFPVRLAFAMTINKAQGQTFDRVGLLLPAPVFSHGQLYVAFSRVRDPANIRVKIAKTHEQGARSGNGVVTSNIVFTEVFRDI